MRSAIFITFMLIGFCAEAQNIIVNGSFEELIACPSSAGELGYAQPWNGGEGSPDLMNVCGLNEWGVPVNRGGGQWPRTGNGYAGIGTYSTFFLEARETLWQPIRYALVAGEEYYFEAYVSLKDSFHYATHNIAVVFEDTMIDETSELECLFQCQPVIENTSANPLTSKTDWVKVSGYFIAEGGEKFIHIGNLRPDSLVELEYVGGGVGVEYSWEESGYYIDDVWLSHIDSAHYVGIEEPLAARTVEVYPNPATDHITITAKQRIAHAQLYDLRGREVAATVGNTATTLQLDVRTLHSGLYVLHGTYANGQRFVTRIVKE